jgi:hypothetical protein
MGKQIKQGDLTKPHLKQFFDIKKIADEPPLNKDGFWPKPKHGIPLNGSKKIHGK